MTYKIAIAGGSTAGLITALALDSIGMKPQVFEIRNYHALKSYIDPYGRAFAISAGSIKVFKEIGLWPRLESYIGEIKEIRVTDMESPLFLHFDHALAEVDKLGVMIENHHLLRLIYEEALSRGIEIHEEQCFSLKNKDEYDLVIVADGKNSSLRSELNIEHYHCDYGQTAIVFKIEHEKYHQNIAYERFYPSGPLALLPLPNPHQSSCVWTEETDIAKELLTLPKDILKQFLLRKVGDFMGEIKIVSEIFSYTLSLTVAKEYYRGNVVLIGDALHAIHPIAGQGLNLSIRDIDELKNLIQEYSSLGLDIGSFSLLEKFQQRRNFDNFKMIETTDKLTKLFSNNNKLLAMLRQIGLYGVNKNSWLKKFFILEAMYVKD